MFLGKAGVNGEEDEPKTDAGFRCICLSTRLCSALKEYLAGRTDGYLFQSATGKALGRIVWRMLPRNGGRALFLLCPYCDTPRRHVYGWEWDSVSGWSNRVRSISWRCRSCARLRYSSKGGYLCGPRMFCALGNLPRPESWLPYVFTSIDDPRLDEIIGAR